jgi:hypothetical protein
MPMGNPANVPTMMTPLAVGTGAYLDASPSSVVLIGKPLNLTCTFPQLPMTDYIYLAMVSGGTLYNIIQVSTLKLAAAFTTGLRRRVDVYLLDDGVSIVFAYGYTTFADTAIYECYVPTSVSSNQLRITVSSSSSQTYPPEYYYVGPPVSNPTFTYSYTNSHTSDGVDVGIVITILIGVVCVVIASVLLALRLKYKERFWMMLKRRAQRPPSYANASAGVSNPIYIIDDQQLPSYNEALHTVNGKAFMPPSYTEVVNGQAIVANGQQSQADANTLTGVHVSANEGTSSSLPYEEIGAQPANATSSTEPSAPSPPDQ